MKYLRSLMQQSVTACKNQAKLIQQFTLSLLYLLIIHIVALLFFFLFRLVLFTSIDYQFPPDIQNNFLMQATAFIKGLWFDNVIACYILLLPLVILWITALCNYHSKWVSDLSLSFSFYFIHCRSLFRQPTSLISLIFLRQSILPFTIGSDMEPLLPEWYWVRHHSISLFF